MKKTNLLSIIFYSILCLSCNNNPNQKVNNNENPIPKDSIKLENKYLNDKIIGKYYGESFNRFYKSGFDLFKEKPKNYFILYSIEFNNTGKIIYKDLTEFYDCGNGVLSIQNGSWKRNNDGTYELSFNGEYSLESKFHIVGDFELITLKEGVLKMNLKKIKKEEFINNW